MHMKTVLVYWKLLFYSFILGITDTKGKSFSLRNAKEEFYFWNKGIFVCEISVVLDVPSVRPKRQSCTSVTVRPKQKTNIIISQVTIKIAKFLTFTSHLTSTLTGVMWIFWKNLHTSQNFLIELLMSENSFFLCTSEHMVFFNYFKVIKLFTPFFHCYMFSTKHLWYYCLIKVSHS